MPEFDGEEFTFPDEAEAKQVAEPVELEIEADAAFEIEVEDDTPEEDRNRQPMPKELVEEIEKDELDKYDEQTKQRLKQMRKVYHDERREKEAALREQREAINLAQRLLEENKRIKNVLTTGEKEYVESMQTAANLQLEMAKRKYKDAYDMGDTDKVIEAQEDMQNANLKLMQIKNFKLPSLQEEENSVQIQHNEQFQPAPTQKSDPKLEKWLDNNHWYGKNKIMTATALGIHEELIDNGYVAGSDEYYSTLDKTMQKTFSDYFGKSEETVKEKVESAPTKPSTVVAPATRSTASNKIKLKASQVQLAKKLGLTNEQYAQAALKLENR
jgi:hypothetical protein